MQDELYAQHDLKKTSFKANLIEKARSAIDEAVEILEKAQQTTLKNQHNLRKWQKENQYRGVSSIKAD